MDETSERIREAIEQQEARIEEQLEEDDDAEEDDEGDDALPSGAGPGADPGPGYGAESGDPFGEGPAEDSEMPLTEHIEEMIGRLAAVFAVAAGVAVLVFPLGEEIINFLWYSVLPGTDIAKPHLYSILELKLTELKVASLAGLIVALPVAVYETYQFMRPGLYPHERRYYLAAIPTSLVLALVGVSFAYFIVLPAIFTYFLYYSQDVAQIGFALGRTFNLILVLMGYLALVFQIPLFVMLAMMMGLVTREWLVQRRLLAWGLFAGLSFIFSPDPTGMSPLIIALTMVVLFEGTLYLSKWTEAGQRQY
ncbi:MAG: twin-arginine translocase subunit TatC [Halobacteriaceae archaeon]